jgi:hypothetical protein
MAYALNMRSAAGRHLQDAQLLFEWERFDNAGYHFGLSAECALKGAMGRVGLRVDEVEVNDRPAYYLHFPELKRVPIRFAGRLSQSIATILGRAQFLQGWDIKMRYSQAGSITRQTCERWREQVLEFNNQCGGV